MSAHISLRWILCLGLLFQFVFWTLAIPEQTSASTPASAQKTSGLPACLSHNHTCERARDCCSASCQKGRCKGNCREDGFPCERAAQCCSKRCEQARCGGACQTLAQRCKRDADCCSQRCHRGRCRKATPPQACDPAQCHRWNKRKKRCDSRCRRGHVCIWGQCQRDTTALSRRPRVSPVRRRPRQIVTARTTRRPVPRPSPRTPLVRRPPHRPRPRLPRARTTPPVRRPPVRRRARPLPPPRRQPRRVPPPPRRTTSCDARKCLAFDPNIKGCHTICPPGTSCDGKGTCISPPKVRCNLKKCEYYDADKGRCVYHCKSNQLCIAGRCKLPSCSMKQCMVFHTQKKRCVSFCQSGQRCDGRGRCLGSLLRPLPRSNTGCDRKRCQRRTFDGRCVTTCASHEVCIDGECLIQEGP